MEKVKYITIQGFDFIITQEFDYNGTHYMIAIDEKGENTITVLKQKIVNGKEFVESVTDDELEMIFDLIKQENGSN